MEFGADLLFVVVTRILLFMKEIQLRINLLEYPCMNEYLLKMSFIPQTYIENNNK